jgi:hypothetical protein
MSQIVSFFRQIPQILQLTLPKQIRVSRMGAFFRRKTAQKGPQRRRKNPGQEHASPQATLLGFPCFSFPVCEFCALFVAKQQQPA